MGAQGKRRVLLAALALVCVSSGTAMAANKLIVKGIDGTTDKFVVTDNGYIGSGTNAPLYALHIKSTGLSRAIFETTGNTTSHLSDSPGFFILRNNVSSVNGGLPKAADRLGFYYFGSKIAGGNKALASIEAYAESNITTTSAPAYLTFGTNPTSGSMLAIERMRITSAGNVGIGTVAPKQRLEVVGGVRLNTTATKPACDSNNRGTVWFSQGGTGVADSLQVCSRDASSTGYAWRALF